MRKNLFRFFGILTIGLVFALSSIPAFGQSFTAFDPPGSIGTAALSINPSGAITGFYLDGSSVDHGFVRGKGGTIATFDPPGSIDTNPSSINPSGVITGYYGDGSRT